VPEAKPYEIPKQLVWDAYQRVKANRGGAGVDGESLTMFEKDLKGNLYKVWNRMSSGSYFPPPVRLVEIPKDNGGTRPLGIPTVGDRVAQTVVKMVLEPVVEPVFHPDSYGYRPGRSALDAVAMARKRCWRADWVIDLDIKGFFDALVHEMVERAVAHHTDNPCFLPAISTKAAKAIRATMREWRMASTRNNQRLEDLARLVNPVVRGWMNYYGRFYRSKCILILRHLNGALAAWARRKYKRLRRRERASMHWLGRIARRDPNLFVLWKLGVRPEAGS
jgi:retron-type reverse transcriptase